MISLTVLNLLALFGGVFMVFAFAKFRGELKRLKRTRQLPDLNTWHVLTPFARGTASLAEPANNLEQIVMIETPSFGPIPLVRTVVSADTGSIGNRQIHRLSAPHSGRKKLWNFRKRSVG
jgi:hypothetical protein